MQEGTEFSILAKYPSYYSLRKHHPAPPRPSDGDPRSHGPFKFEKQTLYWCWSDEHDDWRAAILVVSDEAWTEYTMKRQGIRELADQHRGSMPPSELVAMLIQATIGQDIVFRPQILEVVAYANLDPNTLEELDGFDEPLIVRVLNKHRGHDRIKHLWWVDAAKHYHLHGNEHIQPGK